MIEVKNLQKSFGSKLAVDGISFTVKKGEVLGFLGPNGAGKSTTMRMVTGFLPATEGTISIGGSDVEADEIAAKSKIGYLPESAPLYSDMTVEAFLRFSAEMRGVPKGEIKDAVDKAIATTFLEKVRHQSIETLSKGFRHRTCFAQSIIHDPEVLILDEPTDGLDPNQKHEVRQLIKRMGKTKAIIFSTHILEEVEASCTRAVIIDRGKIIADGTPDQLKNKSKNAGSVVLRLNGVEKSVLTKEIEKLSEVKSTDPVTSLYGEEVALRVFPAKGKSEKLVSALSKVVAEKGGDLKELKMEQGRLDELFREITKSDNEE